jgi:hypothetical protein
MPVIQVQDEFQSGDNVTASSLNDLVNDASFVSGAVDNSTLQVASAGHLKVKDNGILSSHLKSDPLDTNDSQRAVTTNHIRNDAVTNAKIADSAVDTDQIAADAVTYAKMQNVAPLSVIGNNTNASANPTAIAIDDLKDNISNATAHTTDDDSDGINESGGADGLMSAEDKTKLDGVEAGATGDQTGAEMKTAIGNATAHTTDSDSDGINESGGTNGLLTANDKTKLDGIEAGAEVNVQSDWDATSGDAFIKNKPTIAYTSAISNATESASGLMSSDDKTKLDSIETGAEVNPSNATAHTSDSDLDGTDGLMSAGDKTKLDGIAAGATANAGTVTSITAGTGLSGGTITSLGTISLDTGGVTSDKISSTDSVFKINSSDQVRFGGNLQESTLESISQFGITSSTASAVATIESTSATSDAVLVIRAPDQAIVQLRDTNTDGTNNGKFNVGSGGGELFFGSVNDDDSARGIMCSMFPKGTSSSGGVFQIQPITVAELIASETGFTATAGMIAYVSDGDSGSPCLAVHDGSSFKRVALGTTISAT